MPLPEFILNIIKSILDLNPKQICSILEHCVSCVTGRHRGDIDGSLFPDIQSTAAGTRLEHHHRYGQSRSDVHIGFPEAHSAGRRQRNEPMVHAVSEGHSSNSLGEYGQIIDTRIRMCQTGSQLTSVINDKLIETARNLNSLSGEGSGEMLIRAQLLLKVLAALKIFTNYP